MYVCMYCICFASPNRNVDNRPPPGPFAPSVPFHAPRSVLLHPPSASAFVLDQRAMLRLDLSGRLLQMGLADGDGLAGRCRGLAMEERGGLLATVETDRAEGQVRWGEGSFTRFFFQENIEPILGFLDKK